MLSPSAEIASVECGDALREDRMKNVNLFNFLEIQLLGVVQSSFLVVRRTMDD